MTPAELKPVIDTWRLDGVPELLIKRAVDVLRRQVKSSKEQGSKASRGRAARREP